MKEKQVHNLRLSDQIKIIFFFLMFSCFVRPQTFETRDDFKIFYDQYNVSGSFVLYEQNEDKYIFYNQSQFRQPFTPASTFKICNSLIGLETGVIKDENFVLPWDSVTRWLPTWNKDQDLKSAFKNSTVWYYQELARRVGGEKMKYWLDLANYGNADTSGGIDHFWLTGGLRITPEQQINFLRRLHDNKLPFSQRSMEIVKEIMIAKDTLNSVVHAKTGWGEQDDINIGWYVGYVEMGDNAYYFANSIQSAISENKDFARARIEIVYQIFNALKLIKK
jgi:beta-lactamase class D